MGHEKETVKQSENPLRCKWTHQPWPKTSLHITCDPQQHNFHSTNNCLHCSYPSICHLGYALFIKGTEQMIHSFLECIVFKIWLMGMLCRAFSTEWKWFLAENDFLVSRVNIFYGFHFPGEFIFQKFCGKHIGIQEEENQFQ